MTVEFSCEIQEGAKVVIPISMQTELRGEKLNETIEALVERHKKSTTYYSRCNGQVESTKRSY